MSRIQIPDRQELAFSIEETLRAAFPQVHFWVGRPAPESADLVLEVDRSAPPTPESMRLRLTGGSHGQMTFRLPLQWPQLKEELRRRLDSLDVRPLNLESSSELPALGDELFTLGGVPVPREPALTEPHPVIDDLDDGPASPAADPPVAELSLPIVQLGGPEFLQGPELSSELPLADEVFSLGTSERRMSELASVPGEQVTAPGILRRNTVVASVEELAPASTAGGRPGTSSPDRPGSPVAGPFEGNVATHFLRLHHSAFTGVLELAMPQFTVRMSWEDGAVRDLEGYAPILQHLLALAGAGSHFAADLTRTLSDPIEWAVRRQLISPEEETKWLLRCRREAIRLVITASRCPVVVDGAEFRRHLPPLDPKPLLFSGVVEHFPAELACALCDCEGPSTVSESWNPLFDDPDFDPLWVRAVHLLSGGAPWAEACIRAGLSMSESWTLAYACRLFQVCGPALTGHLPEAELLRRRFRTLEENLRAQPPDQFFGGSAAAARRVQQDILVQCSELPPPLRTLLAADIEKLKKSMDKSMSLLSF